MILADSLFSNVDAFVLILCAGVLGQLIVNAIQAARPRTKWKLVIVVVVFAVLGLVVQSGVNWYRQYQLDHGTVRFAVQLKVEAVGGSSYKPAITAIPGQLVQYALVATNLGTGIARHVAFGVKLAPYMTLVCGSPRFVDSNTSAAGLVLPTGRNGDCGGSGIVTGGQYLDDLYPGASETLFFQSRLDRCIPAGTHALQTVGIVRSSKDNETYNVATVNLDLAVSNAAGCGVPSG
jgi:hypothetical protein